MRKELTVGDVIGYLDIDMTVKLIGAKSDRILQIFKKGEIVPLNSPWRFRHIESISCGIEDGEIILKILVYTY